MSYCRWSDSDVYAYECVGGVQFWVASDDSLNRLCNTFIEAYQYAKELYERGIDIPDYAIEALREDATNEWREGVLGVEAGGRTSETIDLTPIRAEAYMRGFKDGRNGSTERVEKLEELVRDLLGMVDCEECAYDECVPNGWRRIGCIFESRARELGIEVG